jgi:hypothetical protein
MLAGLLIAAFSPLRGLQDLPEGEPVGRSVG